MVGLRGNREASLWACYHAILLHQPCNAIARTSIPFLAQDPRDPRTPITPVVLYIDRAASLQQLPVLSLALGELLRMSEHPMPPLVIARTAHLQHPALVHHAVAYVTLQNKVVFH